MAQEEKLLGSIDPSPIATVITNPRLRDNPIIAANRAFIELTGFPEDEIVGRNCRFLSGPGTEPWLTEKIRESIRSRRPSLTELVNYRRDGTPFRNAVMVAPVFDDDGEVAYFLGSQMDTGEDVQSPAAQRRARATALVAALSPRQRQILEEMAAGYRNKQIAWRLSLSEKTVKMHRALLLERLGAKTSADAIRIAVEAGL